MMYLKKISTAIAILQDARIATAIKENIRKSSKIIKESFFALIIAILVEIFAGIFLGSINDLFFILPGLMIIIPATRAACGNIFSSIGSRLATKMHTGEINLVEFKNIYKDPIIKKNKVVSIVQTLNISFLIGLIGYIIGKAFGFEMMPFQDLIIISMSTAILANIILRHYTIFIATKSFERGWDPDNINTPLIAAFGDLITIPILFVVSIFCSFLREYYIIYTVVPFVLISASILSLIYGLNKKNLKETIIQSLPALTICIIITILSGIILEYNIQMIAVVYLVILMATPSFSTWGGNLGGIFASRMTSSLYTGITTKIRFIPSFESVKDLFPYIFLSVCLSLVLSIILHTISFIFGVSSPGFSNLLYICVITGLAITLISLLISYLLTYLSWQFGIDPDNMVIPLIASIMDVIGTACLITSLNIVCI